MARLIDADALKIDIACVYGSNPKYLNWLNNAPTVDAVPVRHGKWLPENRAMDAYWVCSCCGFPSEAHGAFKIYKYCPNCGARMDEE